MDIIAKSVLQFVQKQKPHAVIAGGAARDEYLNLTPRDYDIWLQGKYDLSALINEYDVQDLKQKGQQYDGSHHDTGIREVYNFSVEGKNFDLIMYKDNYFEEEEFAHKVVERFDFGLNMIIYDGNSLDDTNKDFRADIDMGTMSLINLKNIEHLPNAVRRFEKFNQKFNVQQNTSNAWRFSAPCLKLLTEESVSAKKKSKLSYFHGGWTAGDGAVGNTMAFQAQPEVQWEPPQFDNNF